MPSTKIPVRIEYQRRLRAVLAVLVTIAALSFLAVWLLPRSQGGSYPNTAIDWLQILAGLVGFWATLTALLLVLGSISFLRYDNAQRRRAASAEQVLSADTRAPILYFRSFDDDVEEADRVRLLNTANIALEESAEAVLGGFLECIGPVVAIGRPGEALPELGFARMYVEHGQWQAKVLDLINRASLVVLRAGHSAGVLWETGQVLRPSVLPRVIVLVPSTTGFDYDQYRDHVRRIAAISLPELPKSSIKLFPLGVRAIIRFEPDGSPCLCDFPEPGPPPPSWIGLPNWFYRWRAGRGDPWFRPQTADFSSFVVGVLRPVYAARSLEFIADDPAKQWDDRWRPTKFDRMARWVVIAIVVAVAALVIFACVMLFISSG